MFRVLLYIFLIYLAYRLIFNFIIPVYRTTRQVKKGFSEMNGRMNEFMNQQQASSQPGQTSTSKNKTEKEPPGDYIDFEEIK